MIIEDNNPFRNKCTERVIFMVLILLRKTT